MFFRHHLDHRFLTFQFPLLRDVDLLTFFLYKDHLGISGNFHSLMHLTLLFLRPFFSFVLHTLVFFDFSYLLSLLGFHIINPSLLQLVSLVNLRIQVPFSDPFLFDMLSPLPFSMDNLGMHMRTLNKPMRVTLPYHPFTKILTLLMMNLEISITSPI